MQLIAIASALGLASCLLTVSFILYLYYSNPQMRPRRLRSYDNCRGSLDAVVGTKKIDARHFYSQYHGHEPSYLLGLCQALREAGESIAWFAGDSSLDNKAWIPTKGYPPQKQYADAFKNSKECKKDVAFAWNTARQEGDPVALNTAIEESTLGERSEPVLQLLQDQLIQHHLREDDVLVVSVGGNDLALVPRFRTAFWLTILSVLPSCLLRVGWIPAHIRGIFLEQTQRYIEKLTSRTRPRCVIVCMFYYPSVVVEGWASFFLDKMGYKEHPRHIHRIIDNVYESCTKQIRIKGTRVIPVHLGRVLDWKSGEDYVACVEPSESGGLKMARRFLKEIKNSGKGF